MPQIFQSAKRLISICLVTLLVVTGTFFSFPAPAKADTDVVIVKCESDCSNLASFTAGVVAGSAVTLMATGQGEVLAAVGAGVTTMAHTAVTAAVPLAAAALPTALTAVAPAVAAAAPVIVPVAAVGAVGYGAYRVWEGHQNSQVKASK